MLGNLENFEWDFTLFINVSLSQPTKVDEFVIHREPHCRYCRSMLFLDGKCFTKLQHTFDFLKVHNVEAETFFCDCTLKIYAM